MINVPEKQLTSW